MTRDCMTSFEKFGVVGGGGRVEERVERHLGVDHDVAAPGLSLIHI